MKRIRTSEQNRAFFRRRQAQHLDLAERCDSEGARNLHLRFAAIYARRADEDMVEPD